MTATWRSLELLVTTHCNRKCPECCYRIPQHETLPAAHYDWGYFERAAEHLQRFDTLYVSGGEPTLHPEFGRIATEFRALFRPTRLVLVTNGYCVVQHKAHMQQFDEVQIVEFPDDEDTAAAIAWLRTHPGPKLVVGPFEHLPLSRPGGNMICHRYGIAAYADGKLFPCCVGPGIQRAGFVELCSDWRVHLRNVTLPCPRCAFSEPRPR